MRGAVGGWKETARRLPKAKRLRLPFINYFVVLANFFSWVVGEGFLKESPIAKIKVAKPKVKVVKPYTYEEISKMLSVCDYDYEHNAKFLGSRNKAAILILLDTGARLSELLGMTWEDINMSNGNIRVTGKGNKERVMRIGKVAQKALWRYMMYRPQNNKGGIWLSEEGKGTGQSLIPNPRLVLVR